jgi:hypothetical protein
MPRRSTRPGHTLGEGYPVAGAMRLARPLAMALLLAFCWGPRPVLPAPANESAPGEGSSVECVGGEEGSTCRYSASTTSTTALHDPSRNPRVLHLSFHEGTRWELHMVGEALGISIDFEIFPSSSSSFPHEDCEQYNIDRETSARVWAEHGARWQHYDVVITSDTAP